MLKSLLVFLLPMLCFGQTGTVSRMATEKYAAYLATNAAAYAVAPVAVTASNALAQAESALARPVGVSSGYVASVIGPVATLATNALEAAEQALARPTGIDTGVVESLAGVLVSNHNLSASAHEDIRASVSNAVDLVTGAVKTNSVGGLAVGEGSTADGQYGFATGNHVSASGTKSFALGDYSVASGDVSWAGGYSAHATDSLSFVWSADIENIYYSHGIGTHNISPVGGTSGFFIGETSLQTFLDERLSVEHENESSAHGGRITALEARPTGLTTNTPFPFVMLIDPYSTNGVVRMAVSNGIFQIWGLK